MTYFVKLIICIAGAWSCVLSAAPKWALTVPVKAGYIIGIGIGDDISEAKTLATTDIANTLYANVSSVFLSTATTSGNTGLVKTNSQHRIDSEDVLLPNITVEQRAESDGVYYVLASVSKQDVIALYNKNLSIALKPFENIQKKSDINLNDYLFLVAHQSTLALAAKRASAISSIANSGQVFHQKVYQLLAKQNQFIDSICFTVKKSHDRLADKIYLPSIESAIQADRFQLSNKSNCIAIKFRSKTQRIDSHRADVVMQLDIGQPAAVNKLVKFSGTSDGSYKAAMFDAADNFSNFFNRHGGLLNALLNNSDKTIEIAL